MLQGNTMAAASQAIIAHQSYLQSLAPIEVTIPFADALGRAILAKAKVADPRLTREFPRIAGFTAAHALLCIQLRQRADDGSIIATLDDYEAARNVIRELSTVREFSRFAIEAWNVAKTIFTDTGKPVTVGQISKAMLKDHRHVARTVNLLLQGGALRDMRDKPSRTAPHLVIPSAETPCQILLPSVEELEGITPPVRVSKPEQVSTGQQVNLSIQALDLTAQVNAMSGNGLDPLGQTGLRDDKPFVINSETYTYNGQNYRHGDTLPDGRLVTIEGGIPILIRRRGQAPVPEVRL
jgi:hypothetical protein